MGFFGNVGNFITKNLRSGVKDVQGVILPILNTKGGEAAVKGIVAAKTGGASLQGGFNSFGGIGTGEYAPGNRSENDLFSNLFNQLTQSTGATKKETPQGTTVSNEKINTINKMEDKSLMDFIRTNKVTIGALTGIGLIIYMVSKKKNKPVRRTKRRTTSTMTARQKQLAALAKGRRTRLRNLRAKKK
jgi:hypothetical protein